MYNTKSEHYVDYRFEMIMMCQHRFIDCNKCTMVQDMDSEGSYVWWGLKEKYMSILCIFCSILQWHKTYLEKNVFLKRDPKFLSLKISKLTDCKKQTKRHPVKGNLACTCYAYCTSKFRFTYVLSHSVMPDSLWPFGL